MKTNLPEFFDILDSDIDDSLTGQHEGGQTRVPFKLEHHILSLIGSGNTKKLLSYYKKLLLVDPNLTFTVGRLSKNDLQHFKYMAVSSIALVCRVAIVRGTPEATAYGISDDAIQHIDSQTDSEYVLRHLIKTVYIYASLIEKNQKNTRCSKPVRESLEYIAANLRSKITFDDLVAHTHYNRDYLARLFKKETGMSVNDYILNLRIQTAQELLLDGLSSSEIAYKLQFCSQSYFIKQFKKIVGLTPKDYLNLYQIKSIVADDILDFPDLE